MRIAFLVCPEQPVPPVGYGGAERCTDIMVRRLMEFGHQVDLYCGKGSSCKATNVIESRTNSMSEESYLANIIAQNHYCYDVIIDYSANHIAGQYFTNVLSLMGGDPYKKYPHDDVMNRVYKSHEFACFNDCPDHPHLHNVIEYDARSVPLYENTSGHALYVGTVHPMKGIHIAAAACEELGIPLHVYGPIRDVDYWNSFRDSVSYFGMLGTEKRDFVFGLASVFVHPVQCCDCDPLAPKEAMLRGTPVVCCPIGGLLSSVEQGVSGFFANTHEEFKECIKLAASLDRRKVRESIEPRVDSIEITRKLESLCEKVVGGAQW